MPIYTTPNGKRYEFDNRHEAQDFERDYPDAKVELYNGDVHYNVPLKHVDAFFKKYPDGDYWSTLRANQPEPKAIGAPEEQKPGFWERMFNNLSDAGKAFNSHVTSNSQTLQQDYAVDPELLHQISLTQPQQQQQTVSQPTDNPYLKARQQQYNEAKEKSAQLRQEQQIPPVPNFSENLKGATLAQPQQQRFDYRQAGNGFVNPATQNRMPNITDVDKVANEERNIQFTPKKVETGQDIMDNAIARFSLTEEGQALQAEADEALKQHIIQLSDEFSRSPEYKELTKQQPKNQQELDELNEKLNTEFQKKYEKEINSFISPYYQRIQDAAAKRYEGTINEESKKLNVKNSTKVLSSLTDEIKDLREKHGQTASANLRAARKLVEESNNLLRAVDKGGLEQAGLGFWDNLDERTLPFIGGFLDWADNETLRIAINKFEKGENLNKEEEALLTASAVNMTLNAYYDDQLRGYKIGSGVADSLPYMMEFIAVPLGGTSNAMAKSLLKFGMKKFGAKAVNSAIPRFGARLASEAATAALRTETASLPRVFSDMASNLNANYSLSVDGNGNLKMQKVGDTTPMEAFSKSLRTNFYDNFGETAFDAVKGIGKFVPEKFAKALKYAENTGIGQIYKHTLGSELAKRAEWHGAMGEYLEEVLTNLMNAASGDMKWEDVADFDKNVDTFLQVLPVSVLFGMGGATSFGVEKYQNKKAMEAAFGQMNDTQKKQLAELQEMAKDGRKALNRGIKNFLKYTINDETLTQEEKRAEIEYLYEMAKGKAIEEIEAERTPEQKIEDNVEEAKITGAEAVEPADMNQIGVNLQAAAQDVESTFGVNILNSLDADPMATAIDIQNNPAYTIEEKQIALDFINAKSAYDGMIERIQGDINSEIEASDEQVNQDVNATSGMVQPIVLKDNNRKGYVVNGNLVLNEDGTIDLEKSQKDIIIRYKDTGELKFFDVSDILSADSPINPDELKAANAEAIRQAKAQEQAAIIDGTLAFAVGDTYQAVGEDGTPAEVTIISDNGDGTVNVGINGEASAEPMAKDALQQMVDNYKLQQVQAANMERRAAQTAQQQETAPAERTYQLNEQVPVTLPDGTPGTAFIQSEPNADGQYEVELQDSNGTVRGVSLMSQQQLNDMEATQPEVEQEPAPTPTPVSSDISNEQQKEGGEGSVIEVSDIDSVDVSKVKPGQIYITRKTDEQGYTKIKLYKVTIGSSGRIRLSTINNAGARLNIPLKDLLMDEDDWTDEDRDVFDLDNYSVTEVRLAPDGRIAGTLKIKQKSGGFFVGDYAFKINPLDYISKEQLNDKERAAIKSAEQSNVQAAPVEEVTSEVTSQPEVDEDTMPMIGEGEDAEPDFGAVSPQRAHQYLYQESGLDEADADEFVKAYKKDAEDALKKIQNKPPKPTDKEINKNIQKFNAAKKAWQESVDLAQRQVEYWNAVEQEQGIIVRQREAVAKAEEQINKWESLEQARQEEAEAPKETTTTETATTPEPKKPEKKTNKKKEEFTPRNLEELAAYLLGDNSKRGIKLIRQDWMKETGYGNDEAKKYFPIFAKKENGGITVSEAGDLLQEYAADMGIPFDVDDPNAGRNAILSIFQQGNEKWTDLKNYIKNSREYEAQQLEEGEEELRDEWYFEHFGVNYDDYHAGLYDELMDAVGQEYADVPEEIYEQIIDEDNTLNTESNGRDTEEEAGIEGSSAVLQGTQSVLQGRNGEAEGQSEEAVTGVRGENEAVPESTSRGEVEQHDGYTVEPYTYTRKNGSTIDMLLVKFDNLDDDTKKKLSSAAREMKGWWSREDGGFLLRNNDDVQKLADIANEDVFQMAERISAETEKEAENLENTQENDNFTLTLEALENSDLDEFVKSGARAWINGDKSPANQLAYLAAEDYVRNFSKDHERGGSNADIAQLGSTDNGVASRENGRGNGESGLVDTESGGEGLSSNAASGKDSAPDVASSNGEGGNRGLFGNPSEPNGDIASGESAGSSPTGSQRSNGRGRGKQGSSRVSGKDADRGTKAAARAELDDALSDFEKILKESFTEPVKGKMLAADPVSLYTYLGAVKAIKLLAAGSRVAYAAVKLGYYEFKDWYSVMKSKLGDMLRNIAGMTDDQIDGFIEMMWDYSLTIDGETHKISEWASIIGDEKLRDQVSMTIDEKRKLQKQAEDTPTIIADITNIRESLPFLLPKQQDDVQKAEKQFFSEEHADAKHGHGKGYMFTNGTGTGKTYTGLGIIKRFLKQGKKRILIVTAQETKIKDWINDAKNLGIEASMLPDTKSKGSGVVVTQYANIRQNRALLEDVFDLIVYDESHKLMENQDGMPTSTSRAHHMLANRDERQAARRILMAGEFGKKVEDAENELNLLQQALDIKSTEWSADVKKAYQDVLKSGKTVDERVKELREIVEKFEETLENEVNNYLSDPEHAKEAREAAKKTKVVFLSATPFNTPANLDYAEGYTFSYTNADDVQKEIDRMKSRDNFLVEHFNASHQRNPKTQNVARIAQERIPDPLKASEEEVAFSDYIQNELETMSGRDLDSEYDYSREFPKMDFPMADKFNDAIQSLSDGRFNILAEFFDHLLKDYNTMTGYLEIFKAQMIAPRIRQYIDLGKKVTLFHRRKASNTDMYPPFALAMQKAMEKSVREENEDIEDAVDSFKHVFSDLFKWESSIDYMFPQDSILEEFMTEKEKTDYKNAIEEWKNKYGSELEKLAAERMLLNFQIEDEYVEDRDKKIERIKEINKTIEKIAKLKPRAKSALVSVFNGSEKENDRRDAIAKFNDDKSKTKVLVVQVQSGKEGISLHDTTGEHPRVLIGIFLPQSPIEFIQTEGRIFRVGNKSNAIFEYPLLGLDIELSNFALKINGRSETTENLALGSRGRGLKDSISRSALASRHINPQDAQGIGGKELDNRKSQQADGFTTAMQNYDQWRTDEQPTDINDVQIPDPIGYMMVKWGNPENGERVLVPNARKGSVARYVPTRSRMTATEQRNSDFARLAALVGGSGRKVLNEPFEDHAYINKYDLVVVNTGHGTMQESNRLGLGTPISLDAKDAMKTIRHLDDSGRAIMLVSSDKVADILSSMKGSRETANMVPVAEVKLPSFVLNGTPSSILVVDRVDNKDLRDKVGQMQTIDLSDAKNEDALFAQIRDVVIPNRNIDKVGKITRRLRPMVNVFANTGTLAKTKDSSTGKMKDDCSVYNGYLDLRWKKGKMVFFKADGHAYSGFWINGQQIADNNVDYITDMAKEWVNQQNLLSLSDEDLFAKYKRYLPYRTDISVLGSIRDAIRAMIQSIELALDKTPMQIRNIAEGKVENEVSGSYDLKGFREVFDSLNPDDAGLEALADKVFDAVSKIDGIQFRVVSGNAFRSGAGHNVVAHYVPSQNVIELNSDIFNSIRYTDEFKAQTIVHEMIHALTTWALNAYDNEATRGQLSQQQQEACKIIKDVFAQINNDAFRYELRKNSKLEDNAEYGLTNEHEMMAELANPVFRAMLKAKNLWRQLINGIKMLLGIEIPGVESTQTDALTELENALDTLIDNFDPELYKRFTQGGSYAVRNYMMSQKAGANINAPSQKETELRDALSDIMRNAGIEVIDDVEEGQRVLDEAGEQSKKLSKAEALDIYQKMEDGAEIERIVERTPENWEADFGKDNKVNTPLGVIKLSNDQYLKAGRKDRIKRFGLIKPTLERPDVIVEKYSPEEGSERDTKYVFIKSFLKPNGERIINFQSVTVKQGNEEVSISNHEIDPPKVIKELRENKMLWNRFSYDSNPLGENQGLAITQTANNPSSSDSVLNPHSNSKDTTNSINEQEKSKKSSKSMMEGQPMFFRTSDGQAYGYTLNGKIYIDPRIATADTPIHEFAHLWAEALRSGNAEEWSNVVGLMKGTSIWDEVARNYPELKTDDALAEEVLAHYSGSRGAKRLRKAQEEAMKKANGVFEKAEIAATFDNVRRALSRFWRAVADFLNIHYTNAEEVADRVLYDLLNGVNPSSVTGKSANSNVRSQKVKDAAIDTAAIEQMSDEELLENIDLGGAYNDDPYAIEYDDRHQDDYDAYYAQAEEALVNEKPEVEVANDRLSALLKQWRRLYNTDQRIPIWAQINALDSYIAVEEAKYVDAQVPEEFTPGVQPKQENSDTTTYITTKGKEVEYQQLSLDFTEDIPQNETTEEEKPAGIDLTQIRLRPLKEGETCHVERRFTRDNTFTLTGGKNKIESPEDIAYIFRCLEDKAIEHAFIVLVKDGQPTIVHVGMGAVDNTLVDSAPLAVLAEELKPDHIYFIHNHPSGNLKPSTQDIQLTDKLHFMASKVPMTNMIIDTYKHQYRLFNSYEADTEGNVPSNVSETQSIPLFAFDETKFEEGFSPVNIKNSSDIFNTVYGLRFGEEKKMGYLVLDHSYSVLGNMYLDVESVDAIGEDVIKDMLRNATLMKGSHIALYGTVNLDKETFGKIHKDIKRFSGGDISVLDVLELKGNNGDYSGFYSFHDHGVMDDVETPYGFEVHDSGYEPTKTGKGYKVFVLKDGKLYPPMVANPNGEATPVGVWMEAQAAPVTGTSKTGRPQVKAGGKGTQGGSGTLAFRPGWHLGEIPYASQFNRKDANGDKSLFPKNFVWAEVEYANDVDYQDEARKEGINENGKYQHSLAGLKKVPANGSYRYRTNPNPNTDEWIITGAMKVNRILKPSEVDAMVTAAGREPQQRQEGAVTDEQVQQLNENLFPDSNTIPARQAGEDIFSYAERVAEADRKRREKESAEEIEEEPLSYDDAVKVADNFARENRGAGRYILLDSSKDREGKKQQLLDAGIGDADAERWLNDKKSSALYSPKYDMVVILKSNVGETKLNSYLWHENVHRAIENVFGQDKDRLIDITYRKLFLLTPLTLKLDEKVREAYEGDPEYVIKEEYIAHVFEAAVFSPFDVESFMDNTIKVRGKDGNLSMLRDIVNYVKYGNKEGNEDGRSTRLSGRVSEKSKEARTDEVRNSERANTGKEAERSAKGVTPTPLDINKAEARAAYEAEVTSTAYEIRESLQDSMRGLHALYKAVLGDKFTHIEDVPEFENAYTAENRMSSQNLAEQTEYVQHYLNPLLDAVHKLAGSDESEWDELTDYMMAKHGLERNKVLAERDARRVSEEWKRDALLEVEANLKRGISVLRDKLSHGLIDQDAFDNKMAELNAMAEAEREGIRQEAERKFFAEAAENRNKDYAGLTALTGNEPNEVAAAEAEAQRMVDEYESAHDAADIKELWDKTRAATHNTLEKTYKSGLQSKDSYENTLNMFEYYVPLRGFSEKTSDQVYDYLMDDSGPLKGSVLKTAEGRRSKADNPIVYIAQMANKAIMEGNRNRMKQHFLNFVLNHPSDLVSVSDVWIGLNETTGEWEALFPSIDANATPEEAEQKMQEFEERMNELHDKYPDKYKRVKEQPNIPYRVLNNNLREHQVMVKRNGVPTVITINSNPRAAQALNGMTNPDSNMSRFMQFVNTAVGEILRFMSNVYTSANPPFVLSNFLRDFSYTATISFVKENANYAAQFEKNRLRFNPLTMHRLFRKFENGTLDDSNETERLFHQFMLNGGETGYTNVLDIAGHRKEIVKALKMKDATAARKILKAIAEQYDMLNRSVENVARFAAFVTSREMGRSIGRSIWDAKEISVNFNKKGSADKFFNTEKSSTLGNIASGVSTLMRLTQVFFNAAVQALTNIARAGKRNPKKFSALASGLAAIGLMQPIVAELFSGGGDGDDDDEYYNIPEYVRRSHIMVRIPGTHNWAMLPLTQEYRAIFGLGEMLSGMITGKETYEPAEAAKKVAELISQALPVDMMEGAGGIGKLVPSQAQPIYETWVNKDWTGLPIYRKDVFPGEENKPEWTRVYKSADQTLVGLSKALNELTGGEGDFKQGWADINPAVVEHIMEGYLGGYWTTVMQVKKTAETLFGDRDFDPRNIFLLSRVMYRSDERTQGRKTRELYYKYKEEAEKTKQIAKGYENQEEAGIEGAAEKADFYYLSDEYGRYQIYEKYRPEINAARKSKAEAEKEGDETEAKLYSEEENDLMKQMVEEMEQFNKERK